MERLGHKPPKTFPSKRMRIPHRCRDCGASIGRHGVGKVAANGATAFYPERIRTETLTGLVPVTRSSTPNGALNAIRHLSVVTHEGRQFIRVVCDRCRRDEKIPVSEYDPTTDPIYL